MEETQIKLVIEAALLAAGRPLPFEKLVEIFARKGDGPDRAAIRQGLEALAADYEGRGIELKEVSSGFRIQVRSSMADWLQPLWEERAPRYTRALLETLALIAYRQPITRGEIEEVRGVAVSTNIVRTLMERGWVRVVGHRDVPGKPAMLGTTREFLDYFGLKKLEDLPELTEFDEEHPRSSPQGDFIESLDGEESAEGDAAGRDGESDDLEVAAAETGKPADDERPPVEADAAEGISGRGEGAASEPTGTVDTALEPADDNVVAFASFGDDAAAPVTSSASQADAGDEPSKRAEGSESATASMSPGDVQADASDSDDASSREGGEGSASDELRALVAALRDADGGKTSASESGDDSAAAADSGRDETPDAGAAGMSSDEPTAAAGEADEADEAAGEDAAAGATDSIEHEDPSAEHNTAANPSDEAGDDDADPGARPVAEQSGSGRL